MSVRREYQVETLDPERAARFAAAALLNVLAPTDWQISSDLELVVGQYTQLLRDRGNAQTAAVEVTVHNSHVQLVISADDPDWIDERVRLRPRRPFTPSFDCGLGEWTATLATRPALWPALDRPRAESSPDEWREMWDALHEVTQSIRLGHGDLATTLEAIATGVVKATGFTVAVVNLVVEGGDFRVVAVHGPDEARAALLGVVEPAKSWTDLIDGGTRWGSLRYLRADEPLMADSDMTSWVGEHQTSSGVDRWNPMDLLLAPLFALDGTCLGVLSVDLPADGIRPGVPDLERLEVFADHAAAAIERAQTGKEL